jgi:hypothetical protein
MALTATFAADFSKFNSAVENATVRLQTFERGTKNAGKSLSAMAEGFSGQRLVREATLMSQAVERVGGVSKLTEAEIRRVAATTEQAVEKLRLMGAEPPAALKKIADESGKAAKELDKVDDAAKKSGLSFKQLVAGVFTAQAAYAALASAGRAALGFVSDSIDEYAKAERAQRQLTAALTAQGTALPSVIAQYRELGSQFQRTTVYSDDLIAEMQALLVQVGDAMPSEMDEALKAATNLASGLGIDLRTATLAVGKAMAGEAGSLKRYGIAIDEAKVSAEGAAAIFGEINKQFGGQAQAQAESYAGRIEQAANAWSDYKESIGQAILSSPIVIRFLSDATENLQKLNDANGQATESQTGFTAALQGSLNPIDQIIMYLERQAEATNVLAEATRRAANLPSPFAQSDAGRALPAITAGLALFNEQVTENEERLKRQKKAQDEATRAAEAYAKAVEKFSGRDALDAGNEMVKILGQVGGLLQVPTAQLGEMAQAFEKAAEGAEALGDAKLAAEFRELARTMAPVIQFQQRYNVTLGEFEITSSDATRAIIEQAQALDDLGKEISFGVLPNLMDLSKMWVEFKRQVYEDEPGKKPGIFTSIAQGLLDIDIPGTIARAFEGGGDIKGALKSIASQVGSVIGGSLGAAIGGPIGKQVGAALGSLVTLIPKLFGRSATEDVMNRVGTDWGVSISEGLAQAISDTAKRLFGGSRQAAELFNFDKILDEAGGLSEQNVEQMTRRLRDIFVMVETGRFTVEQATDAMNRSFGEFADYWEEKGGLVSDQMREIIELSRRMGIESDEVSDFIDGQVKAAGSGLGRFLSIGADAQKKLGDNQKRLAELQAEYAKAGVDDQKRIAAEIKKVTDEMRGQESIARALGVTTERGAMAAGAAIAAMVAELQRNGATLPEALREMQPAIDNLQAQLERVGLTGGPAFDELARLSRIAGDAVSGPILDGVAGIGEALTGLSNSALLTEDVFAGLAGQVTQAFDELVASGVDGNDALRLMQPTLQRLWELQRRFGYEVDESTQRLIDQAAEAGLVGEDMLDPQERMLELQERMVEALEGIAEHFGVVLSAGEEAARGIGRAIDTEIPDEIRIPVEFDVREAPDLDFPRGGPRTQGDEGFASGTLGRLGKWFGDFGQGTPTTLHGDEAVVTKDQAPQFARDILAASGGGGGGSVMVLPVIMGSGNVDETVEAALRAWPRAMAGNRHQIRAALMGVFGGR